MQYLYVFIGGAFGALLRYGLSIFNEGSSLPIGIDSQPYRRIFNGIDWYLSNFSISEISLIKRQLPLVS